MEGCALLWTVVCCYGGLCVAMEGCVLLWRVVCCYGGLSVVMVACDIFIILHLRHADYMEEFGINALFVV